MLQDGQEYSSDNPLHITVSENVILYPVYQQGTDLKETTLVSDITEDDDGQYNVTATITVSDGGQTEGLPVTLYITDENGKIVYSETVVADANGEVVFSAWKPSEEGVYEIRVTYTGDSANNSSSSQGKTIYADPFTPKVKWVLTATAVYGDKLSDVVLDGESANVEGTFSFDTASASVGSVGTKEFTRTFTPNDPEYHTVQQKISITVTPKQLTYTGITIDTKTYDGNTEAVVSGGSLSGVINGDAIVVTPSAEFADSNAGSTKVVNVSYTLTGDTSSNYSAPDSEQVTGTILKKALTDSMVGTIAAVTYNGNAQEPSLTVGDGEPSILSDSDYTIEYKENIIPGTATVTVATTENGNYTGSIEKNFEIQTATQSATETPYQGVYDGQPHAAIVEPEGGNVYYSMDQTELSNKSGTEAPSFTDAGVYDVYYLIQREYYHDIVGQLQVIIEKKPLTSNMVAAIDDCLYDGTVKTPVPAVTDGTPSVIKDSDYTVTYEANDKAGVAVTIVTANEGGNYSGSVRRNFTILPGNQTIIVTPYSGIYDGNTHMALVQPEGGTIYYSLVQDELSDQSDTNAPVFSAAGIHDIYYLIQRENYVDVTGHTTVTINKKTLTEEMVGEVADSTYDGTAQEPSITVSDGSPSILVAEDYTVTYQRNMDAGDATVTITAAESGNYSGAVTRNFKIYPATQTVTVSPYEGTYDGEFHAALIEAEEASIYYSLSKDELSNQSSVTLPRFNDAGNYDVYYLIQRKNYEDVRGQTVVTIHPKALTEEMLAGIAGQTYNGMAHEPLAEVTDGTPSIIHSNDYTVTYKDNVLPGNAKVIVTANEERNYSGSITGEFTISPAVQEVEVVPYEGIYDGKSHSLTVTAEEAEVSYRVDTKKSLEAPAFTDAGVYTVYYTVAREHYETVNGAATVVIAKRELTEEMFADISKQKYTGEEIQPKLEIMEELLSEDDYTVQYRNNIQKGTASVIVQAVKDSNFTGSVVLDFEIEKDVKSGTKSTVSRSGKMTRRAGTAGNVAAGDSSRILLWIILLGVSVALIVRRVRI